MRRHVRGGRRPRARRPLVDPQLAVGPARPLRRRRARDRLAPAPRARRARRRGCARRGGGDARRHHAGCGHPGAGPDRRAARGPRGGQGDRLGARAAVRARRPPAGPRRRALACADARRAPVPLPARLGRPHALPRCAGARRARGARGTLDDAAGEAFDKGARLLGLPYPGGPALERLARDGDPSREPFPRALAGRPGCDVSFSGLKSALARRVAELGERAAAAASDLAAGYQQAIIATLVERDRARARRLGRDALAIARRCCVERRPARRARATCARARRASCCSHLRPCVSTTRP